MGNCSTMPCDDAVQRLSQSLMQAECAAAMASVPELPEESGGVRSPRLSLDRLACRQQSPQSPTCRYSTCFLLPVQHSVHPGIDK